jgi:prepilin-type N-terminal cleavage/methylation domain-containing protein
MRSNTGFTLVEVAIVLVIVGLLLAGGLSFFTAQAESQKLSEGRAQLAEIKESLLGFAVQRGYLPCPANPTATPLVEDRAANGQCNRAEGTIPGATLGLIRSTDPYGQPFTYRVMLDFADNGPATVPPASTDSNQTLGVGCPGGAVAPPGVSFMLCSLGDISILTASGGSGLAFGLVSAVVMHFRHGPPNGVAGSADEVENTNHDAIFISHPRVDNNTTTPADEEYDDITDAISPALLANRMLQAGKLP